MSTVRFLPAVLLRDVRRKERKFLVIQIARIAFGDLLVEWYVVAARCHGWFLREKLRTVQKRRAWHDSSNPYDHIPKPRTHGTPNCPHPCRTCCEMRNYLRYSRIGTLPACAGLMRISPYLTIG